MRNSHLIWVACLYNYIIAWVYYFSVDDANGELVYKNYSRNPITDEMERNGYSWNFTPFAIWYALSKAMILITTTFLFKKSEIRYIDQDLYPKSS
jgi:hypothetical protein